MKALSFIFALLFFAFVSQTFGHSPGPAETPNQPCRKTVISGEVKDRNGAVVPGVKVALLDNGVEVRSMLSGEDGRYRFVVERGKFKVRLDNPRGGPPIFTNQKRVNCGAGGPVGPGPPGEFDHINWNLTLASGPSATPSPIGANVTPRPSPTIIAIRTPIPTPTPSEVNPPGSPIPGASITPTPEVTDRWESLRNSLEAELRTGGRLAFDPPESMEQGSWATVMARIAPQEVGEALTRGFRHPERAADEVRVAPVMKVILFSDDGAFAITSKSSEEQIVTSPYAQWEWYVQALKSGQHTLHLKVIASIKTPDRGEKALDITVYDKPISVDVSYRYVIGSFVGDSANWKYLIGSGSLITILGIAFGWLRNRFKKQKAASSLESLDGD
jgi:hypothetical protein